MKSFYYKVGDIFRKDRKRYVVKEAPHGTCKGCDFYSINEEGAPECNGHDFLCDEGCRKDEKSVVFMELAKARNATKD